MSLVNGKQKNLAEIIDKFNDILNQLSKQMSSSISASPNLVYLVPLTSLNDLFSRLKTYVSQINSNDQIFQLPDYINSILFGPNTIFPSTAVPILLKIFQSVNWDMEILKLINLDTYTPVLTDHATFWTELNIQNTPGITQDQLDSIALLVEIPNGNDVSAKNK